MNKELINDSLVFERCLLIKYQATSSKGIMLIKASHYEKKSKQFKKAFKDCNIYYMEELILTPDRVKEIENEIKGIS